MLPFSVCMSVYRNDKPEDFRVALNSVIQQTLPPSEIVLVVDGPVPEEINSVICCLAASPIPSKVIRLEKNQGHAVARQTGIKNASYDFIAIMDSDDVSVPTRFEQQIECFSKDKSLSVVGGQIQEFVDVERNIVGVRDVPLEHKDIERYLHLRCPMNQMTVMMKKKDVLAVGGYLHWYNNEDYYLWIRMLKAGFRFRNLPYNLVHVRVGREMYSRRGGLKYFKSEAALQKYMWDEGIIRFPRFCFNVAVRWVVQVMLPNRIRGFLFQKLFRKSKLRRNGSKV